MCGCLSCGPYWGPGLQPRHVPWLGIEPVTLWFTGRHLVYWTTLARAVLIISGWLEIVKVEESLWKVNLLFFYFYFFRFYHFLKYFLNLFLERGEGGRKRERAINVWWPLACLNWVSGLQPSHVPWMGIELATLLFSGLHSIHWATPARALAFHSKW